MEGNFIPDKTVNMHEKFNSFNDIKRADKIIIDGKVYTVEDHGGLQGTYRFWESVPKSTDASFYDYTYKKLKKVFGANDLDNYDYANFSDYKEDYRCYIFLVVSNDVDANGGKRIAVYWRQNLQGSASHQYGFLFVNSN